MKFIRKMLNRALQPYLSQYKQLHIRDIHEINKRLITLESMLEGLYDAQDIQKKYCIACNTHVSIFHAYGPRGYGEIRKNDMCPICNSSSRHRTMALHFSTQEDWYNNENIGDKIKILHFAPEKCFYNKFSQAKNIDYYPVDYNPQFPGIRNVIDIQNINFPEQMFDIIICNGVLEAVPNDSKAMSELKRVLKPGGKLYLNMYYYYDLTSTEEYKTAVNNVFRKYGSDIKDKLQRVDFVVDVVEPHLELTETELSYYGINKATPVVKCTVSDE